MIDEAEFELKFEVCLIEADEWWDNLEPEERVTIYIRNKEKEGGR